MRLALKYHGTMPHWSKQRYHIGVCNAGVIRQATDEEFKTLKSLIPRITAQAKELLGEEFCLLRPDETLDQNLLELFVKRGISKGPNRPNFKVFSDWIKLCAEEYNAELSDVFARIDYIVEKSI